jgi:gluconate 5-dehydrogenase
MIDASEVLKALAGSGAFVLVNGRNSERLNRAVAIINSMRKSALPLQFDVSDEIAVQKAFSEIREKHG